ncbi:hypothetical protein HDV03_000134 [Kappamyces sp. JEL0829]|nr:hypothetical protein HDV03_000134 [Kappamyces sp. JEL0829]
MGAKASKLPSEKVKDLVKKTRQAKAFSSLLPDLTKKSSNSGFCKDCPGGSLTKADFEKIYKDYFPFGDARKYSNYVFRHLDVNQDGIVDFEEFIKGIDISAKGSMEEKLEWSFRLFDLDEDGFISQAEMLAIVDSIYRMVGQTQVLPDDEATATLRVEKVFRLMDTVRW